MSLLHNIIRVVGAPGAGKLFVTVNLKNTSVTGFVSTLVTVLVVLIHGEVTADAGV